MDALQSPLQIPTSSQQVAPQLGLNSNAMLAHSKAEFDAQGETQGDRSFITALFARLNTVCTAGFHNLKALSPEEAQAQIKRNMREWLNEFKASGMDNPALIDYAMGRIRAQGSPFVPTVGEFIALCDEGRLPAGTKSGQDSYSEMLKYNCLPREKREPSKLAPETYHTFSVICESGNLSYFRNLKESKALDYWKDRHAETLARMKEGKQLKQAPAPTEKLEQIRQPASKQTAMSAIQAMRNGL